MIFSGKEYGTASLPIHIKSCARLWEEKELKKPPAERKAIPVAPENLPQGTTVKDITKHNDIVNDYFNNNVMVQCPNCCRTFFEDRIEIHLRSCTSENPHKPPPGVKAGVLKEISEEEPQEYSKPRPEPKVYHKTEGNLNQKIISRPRALMCFIW